MFCAIWELAQSRDCVVHSPNPEIEHYSCAISRLHNKKLHNTFALSRDRATIVRNFYYPDVHVQKPSRGYGTKNWWLCVVLFHLRKNSRVQAMIVWLKANLTLSGDLLVKSEWAIMVETCVPTVYLKMTNNTRRSWLTVAVKVRFNCRWHS